MIPGGIDVDIETGLPLAATSRKVPDLDSMIAQQNRIEMEGNDLMAAMHSPHGQVLIKAIFEDLNRRLDEFMLKDPGCQVHINLLKSLGYTMNVAPEKARATIERLLGFKVAL